LVACTLCACVATKYRMSPKETASAPELNLGTGRAPVDVSLHAVIVYEGPGSWKRNALWDEYVVEIRNQGERALTITAVELADFADAARDPGEDPWKLEEESQTLEERYLREGMAFARSEIPDVLVFGSSAIGGAAGTAFSAASASVATASVVGLPLYYITVFGLDRRNKAAVGREFRRRRLILPLTLLGGEDQFGSFFFPMTPNPRTLRVHWSVAKVQDELELSLEALHGLHAAPSVKATAAPSSLTP
jgi:hypothetical protein